MKASAWLHEEKQKCPLCAGVGTVYNDRQCPGCNGEGTLPSQSEENFESSASPATPAYHFCSEYERLKAKWEAHQEALDYFSSDGEKPGVTAARATDLANEERVSLKRASDTMDSHRQICRSCMDADSANLRLSRGY